MGTNWNRTSSVGTKKSLPSRKSSASSTRSGETRQMSHVLCSAADETLLSSVINVLMVLNNSPKHLQNSPIFFKGKGVFWRASCSFFKLTKIEFTILPIRRHWPQMSLLLWFSCGSNSRAINVRHMTQTIDARVSMALPSIFVSQSATLNYTKT